MFDFLDRATPKTARRLLDRAIEADRRYLHLAMPQIVEQVAADIPKNMRSASHREASFGYEDLPEFSFMIMTLRTDPTLTIFGQGAFSGFMLQRVGSGEGWQTEVSKPAAFPIGPKAQPLAAIFKRQYGISNLADFRRRWGF